MIQRRFSDDPVEKKENDHKLTVNRPECHRDVTNDRYERNRVMVKLEGRLLQSICVSLHYLYHFIIYRRRF